MDIFEFRKEFAKAGLSRADLDENPFKQFGKWFKDACDAEVPEPNAMCISTVDQSGAPSSRMVLMPSSRDFVRSSTKVLPS